MESHTEYVLDPPAGAIEAVPVGQTFDAGTVGSQQYPVSPLPWHAIWSFVGSPLGSFWQDIPMSGTLGA